MAGKTDFAIENGTLTAYRGAGGNITIPAGVKKIGRLAFNTKDVYTVYAPYNSYGQEWARENFINFVETR